MTSSWFESIRDKKIRSKRERHQAGKKWRNTKLTISWDFNRQEKHKVSSLVHTARYKFSTERIALSSFSKELHQIVNTLSNRHRLTILPTIYRSADVLSLFIRHFNNKVKKVTTNIASKTFISSLATAFFFHLKTFCNPQPKNSF